MTNTEKELRILRRRIKILEQGMVECIKKIEDIDSSFNERLRVYIVGLGLTEGCAEDE